MQTRKCLYIVMVMIMQANSAAAAMYLNEGGLGNVLIYPYYTVNNGLNTIYSVVNTTADTKAVSVRFIEGQNGTQVLNFSVYLDAYDSWQGVLIPGVSTYPNHVGENTAVHIKTDVSCAPFLQYQQGFLPFFIELDAKNNNLQRSTEGHIEITEMSTFTGGTAIAADHGFSGFPAFCDAIEADWADNGVYDTLFDQAPVSGGLMGSVSILDVVNGTAINVNAIAIDDFWENNVGLHTAPGETSPDLREGSTRSEVRLNDEVVSFDWSNGIDAVTSLLMHNKVTNEYAYDFLTQSSSEWVVSFPTKSFYTRGNLVSSPFSSPWNGLTSCDDLVYTAWDREQLTSAPLNPVQNKGSVTTFCYHTNVMEILPANQVPGPRSSILGSGHWIQVMAPDNPSATQGGWLELTFENKAQTLTSFSGARLIGLPAVGFQVEKFVNNQVPDDLRATYTTIKSHRSTKQAMALKKLAQKQGELP